MFPRARPFSLSYAHLNHLSFKTAKRIGKAIKAGWTLQVIRTWKCNYRDSRPRMTLKCQERPEMSWQRELDDSTAKDYLWCFHVALGLRTRLRLLLLIRQNHAHIERNETFLCLSRFRFVCFYVSWKVKDWDLDCNARQQTMGSVCFQLRHENWLDFGPNCLSNLKRFSCSAYKWCQINLTMSPCVDSKA